jgi:hypothetical protein
VVRAFGQEVMSSAIALTGLFHGKVKISSSSQNREKEPFGSRVPELSYPAQF